MEKTQSQSNRITKFEVNKPPKFNVIMLNDDETTMDFVVMVLEKVFRKSADEAERLMLQIHNEGQAVVGTYYYDIAKSKATYTIGMARLNGFPLNLTVEQAR